MPALNGGQMLCGTTIALAGSANADLMAEIIGVNGLGGERLAVDGANSGNVSGGWVKMIFSCLAKLTPFTVNISFNNNQPWGGSLTAAPSTCTITWPVATGYATAGVMTFTAGVTKFQMTGELQGRMTATVEITPSGVPTITPGTAS